MLFLVSDTFCRLGAFEIVHMKFILFGLALLLAVESLQRVLVDLNRLLSAIGALGLVGRHILLTDLLDGCIFYQRLDFKVFVSVFRRIARLDQSAEKVAVLSLGG